MRFWVSFYLSFQASHDLSFLLLFEKGRNRGSDIFNIELATIAKVTLVA